MNVWCTPLERVLASTSSTVTFFFRDDDVGWADERLFDLLDLCDSLAVPIDLAAIPTAMHDTLADSLRDRITRSESRLGIHQHGYCHANHEISGRKCEFGRSRSLEQQRSDIQLGQQLLSRYLGGVLDPFFTPPWNRCTQTTVQALEEVEIKLLSRDVTACPFETGKLLELPVTLDWFKTKNGTRLGREQLAIGLGKQIGTTIPIGVMLHHEEMDNDELRELGNMVTCLQQFENVRFTNIRTIHEPMAKGIQDAV